MYARKRNNTGTVLGEVNDHLQSPFARARMEEQMMAVARKLQRRDPQRYLPQLQLEGDASPEVACAKEAAAIDRAMAMTMDSNVAEDYAREIMESSIYVLANDEQGIAANLAHAVYLTKEQDDDTVLLHDC